MHDANVWWCAALSHSPQFGTAIYCLYVLLRVLVTGTFSLIFCSAGVLAVEGVDVASKYTGSTVESVQYSK